MLRPPIPRGLRLRGLGSLCDSGLGFSVFGGENIQCTDESTNFVYQGGALQSEEFGDCLAP